MRNISVRLNEGASVESRLIYLPDPESMEMWSLGYREALADLVYIRGNIATSALKNSAEHQWISRYFDVLHRLDPRFRTIYRWAAVTSIYSGLSLIERDFVETSRRIYDLALEEYPNDHHLLWYSGMVEISEVSEKTGFSEDEVATARSKGIARIRRAASAGASPLVRRLSISLGRGGEDVDIELARAYLRSQILTSTDEDHLQYAKAKLQELSSPAETQRLEVLRAGFFRRLKDEFPYLPPLTFVMLEVE